MSVADMRFRHFFLTIAPCLMRKVIECILKDESKFVSYPELSALTDISSFDRKKNVEMSPNWGWHLLYSGMRPNLFFTNFSNSGMFFFLEWHLKVIIATSKSFWEAINDFTEWILNFLPTFQTMYFKKRVVETPFSLDHFS